MRGERVVIYGAGRGGEILLRELLHNNRHQVHPVGFVDDDVLKTGKKLLGYPILGTFREMDRVMERHGVRGVLVSFNGSAPPERVEALRRYCMEKGLDLKKFAIHLENVDLERKN
jgi:UDP-GlcNAc:undecaprenyl-phosphate GlcNAc-1-phosphate transferase